MANVIEEIQQALTNRLKLRGGEIKIILSTEGYKQPLLVYYHLEYARATGERAHVSAEAREVAKLKADAATVTAITADLNQKYAARTRL